MPFIFKIPPTTGPMTQIFNGTGSIQQFNVPSNVSSISIKMWAAGGGAGTFNNTSSLGGGGGFSSGTLTVTPSSILDIYVGTPGARSIGSQIGGVGGWPNGGAGAGGNNTTGAGGGGFSGIFPAGDFTTPFIIAGGGGGGGTYYAYQGGGLQAWDTPPIMYGQLGSQSAGGIGGQTDPDFVTAGLPGSFLTGGNAQTAPNHGGGGGGSGYYGGGSGAGGDNSGGGGVGGGGSSYIGHLNLNGTGVTIFNNTGNTDSLRFHAGNEGDVDWVASIGHGGASGSGQPGMVIISYVG